MEANIHAMKAKISTCLFLVATLIAIDAAAVDKYSTGSGDWNNAATWSPSGVPGVNDNVIIQNTHTVTYPTSATTGNLTRNGSAAITINSGGSLTIRGNFTSGTSGSSTTVNTGGTMTINGTITIGTQSTLTMAGGSVTASGAMDLSAGVFVGTSGTFKALSFNTTNNGNTNFSNAVGSTIQLTGTSGASSTGNFTSNTTFNNAGTIIIPGYFTQSSAGSFTNSGQMSTGGDFTANGAVQLNPGTTGNSKLSVGGDYKVSGGSGTTVGTNVAPGNYADFIVYGNLSQTNGNVTVNRNGRVGIFGDLSLSGGGNQFTVASGGQVYVDGDGSGNSVNLTSGGNNVNNNNPTATPQFGLYVNGTVANPGGGSTVDADRADKASMQTNNPTFYAFLASQANSPLPVTLLYFKVLSTTDEGVTLNWVTTMEKDFHYFDIERAGTDLHFESLGTQDARGGYAVNTSYEFIDPQPLRGYNYYRLKMVDIDGTFEYSRVISANWNLVRPVSIYPNPSTGNRFSIALNDNMDLPATIQLTNQMGAIVWQGQLDKMTSEIELPEGVKPGLYVARIRSIRGNEVISLFIQ